MKKIFLVFLMLIFSFCLEAEENSDYAVYTSVLWQPYAMWGLSSSDMEYEVDNASTMTYQGSFWHKWGIKLNINFDIDDNIVWKLYRIAGMLGYKRFSIRASKSTIDGTATWKGDEFPGYNNTESFKSEFTTIELLYDFYYPSDNPQFGDPGKTGWSRGSYIGLMYNTVELPIGIKISNNDTINNTKGIYDTVKFQNYGATIGFDNLDGWFLYGKKSDSKYTYGFSIWLSMFLSTWIGWANISDSTLDLLQAMNPELEIKISTIINIGLQFDGIAGLCWVCWINDIKAGISVGYRFSGSIFGGDNGSLINDKDSLAKVTASHGYYYHGVVIKIGISI